MAGRFLQYLNDIERFFCVVRTSGFVLSPRDCERVRDWYLKGVPFQVVLEGLVQGLKSFRFHAARGQKAPHQLSYYSHFIGASVRRFRSAAAPVFPTSTAAGAATASGGTGGTSVVVDDNAVRWVRQLATELALALEREERPEARKALEQAAAHIDELAMEAAAGLPADALSHQLQVLDGDTLAFYHTLLDEARRKALAREADALVSRESGLSDKARQGRAKAILADLLRADLHLLELSP